MTIACGLGESWALVLAESSWVIRHGQMVLGNRLKIIVFLASSFSRPLHVDARCGSISVQVPVVSAAASGVQFRDAGVPM